jgi:hypothetical protein
LVIFAYNYQGDPVQQTSQPSQELKSADVSDEDVAHIAQAQQ